MDIPVLPYDVEDSRPAVRSPARMRYFSPWLLAATLVWLVVYCSVFAHPLALAQHNWPLALFGVGGAIIGNVTAIGGGLVFVPVLMFVYSATPLAALKLTFMSQAAGMTCGASGWLSRGEVPLRLLKWTVPGLVLGSVVSTFALRPNPMLIREMFGPVTLLAGVLTLCTLNRRGGLLDLPRSANWPVAAVSLVGGTITGWVAIGEGEIVAAFCMLAYNLDASRALGLGVVLLSINSILLALAHALIFGGVPWDMAIFTMLGCLWGGRFGPFIAQWFSVKAAKTVFAFVAVSDGILMILQAGGFLAKLKVALH